MKRDNVSRIGRADREVGASSLATARWKLASNLAPTGSAISKRVGRVRGHFPE
jgi:hypothetical protein